MFSYNWVSFRLCIILISVPNPLLPSFYQNKGKHSRFPPSLIPPSIRKENILKAQAYITFTCFSFLFQNIGNHIPRKQRVSLPILVTSIIAKNILSLNIHVQVTLNVLMLDKSLISTGLGFLLPRKNPLEIKDLWSSHVDLTHAW